MRPDDLTSARRAHDDLELRLRDALHHRAQDASPQYRLDSVLERANSAPRRGVGAAAPWAIGLVAAAVVLALALVLPGLIGGPEDPGVPAGTPTPTETVPSEAPTTAPSDTAEPTTSTPTTSPTGTDEATLAALPVYHPAHIGSAIDRIRLYREWVNIEGVYRDAPVEDKLSAAVSAALAGYAPGTDGYLNYWYGVELESASVSGGKITLRLSGPGSSDVSDEEARISVQQLVWTAQAAVGQGTLPVRFEIADGSTRLFGRLPIDRDYNRPASSDLYHEDLAPIWITSPTRGQVISGNDVVITGEATVFEATYLWELIDGDTGSVLRSGHGQASEGAPARGTYEIRLGRLEPGEYIIRVFELSMADGTTVNAEQLIGFTVR